MSKAERGQGQDMEMKLNITRTSITSLAMMIFVARSTATFTDGTFTSGWTDTKMVDTTFGSGATYNAQNLSTGGNPFQHREVTHVFGNGTILVGHFKSSFTWNPGSQGSITSLDYSYDLIHKLPPAFQAVGYALLIEQSGVKYISSKDAIFDELWTPFSHANLTASSFKELLNTGATGSTSPNFTTTGAVMTFGYMSGNTNPGGGTSTRISGLDNYNVNIIPEPCSIVALAFGALGSALKLRRKH